MTDDDDDDGVIDDDAANLLGVVLSLSSVGVGGGRLVVTDGVGEAR